jgi:oxygen-independent coproporphyrinogen-3 oxidase
MQNVGLYIHVPFCKSRCVYCDFDSSVLADGSRVGRYLDALNVESEAAVVFLGGAGVRTVYLGGGTPTVLGASGITALIDSVRSSFDFRRVAEFSCEANPESAIPETLDALLKVGVNRLSLGVQSFDDRLLRWMGRAHTASEAVTAFGMTRRAGFDNVSMDLIYGLPKQTLDDWLAGVSRAVELESEHVSTYCLHLEPDAPITEKWGVVELPDDGLTADMYYGAIDLLEYAGYRQYEISNFAKPGLECRHNVNYWRDGGYVGLGPSAASHVYGERFNNPRGLDAYVESVAADRWPIVPPEPSNAEREARTALVLGLRMMDGVEIAGFESRYGSDLSTRLKNDIMQLTDAGLLESNDDVVRLVRKGFFLSDEVFSRLI